MPALALKTEYRLLNHRGVSINISESHLQIQVQTLETTLKPQLPVPATPNVLKPVFKGFEGLFCSSDIQAFWHLTVKWGNTQTADSLPWESSYQSCLRRNATSWLYCRLLCTCEGIQPHMLVSYQAIQGEPDSPELLSSQWCCCPAAV